MKPTSDVSLTEKTDIIVSLMEVMGGALLIVTPQPLRLIDANSQMLNWLGYSQAELLALPVEQVISCESSPHCPWACTQDAPMTQRGALLAKDGRPLAVDLTGYASTYQGQAVVLLIARKLPVTHPEVSDPSRALGNREPTMDYSMTQTMLDFPSIIGRSQHIQQVCRLIGLVAKTDATVLVQGETGTGKELVGQAVHFHSRRAWGPLVKVNCAALSETLLESELFGHRKGAFTGAIRDYKGRFHLANGGTLILDEICSMSLTGQAKLLRVLQEREFEALGDSTTVSVDVRVIAITNTDLVAAVQAGQFREDLYYRLSAFPIGLPPLRERKEDIPLLVRHFIEEYAQATSKPIGDISPEAMAILMDYDWPGNIRELENAVEYAVILEESQILQVDSLPDKCCRRVKSVPSLRTRLEQVERQIIVEALSQANGVKKRTAQLLGIDQRNLSYFLNKHNIMEPPERSASAKRVPAHPRTSV